MALFGRAGKDKDQGAKRAGKADVAPLVGQQIHCGECDAVRTFTRCWKRILTLHECPCCAMAFENPKALYKQIQPSCPKCEELLEQPGFEYGHCDTCGSKYEVMPGTKPGLLPNQKQRAEMAKYGKVWDPGR